MYVSSNLGTDGYGLLRIRLFDDADFYYCSAFL